MWLFRKIDLSKDRFSDIATKKPKRDGEMAVNKTEQMPPASFFRQA